MPKLCPYCAIYELSFPTVHIAHRHVWPPLYTSRKVISFMMSILHASEKLPWKLLFKHDRQKYYAPQVRPNRCSNPWPPDHGQCISCPPRPLVSLTTEPSRTLFLARPHSRISLYWVPDLPQLSGQYNLNNCGSNKEMWPMILAPWIWSWTQPQRF